MQFITDIDDDVKLLSTLYKTSSKVKEYMEKVGFADILLTKPELTGKETKEEAYEARKKQYNDNMAEAVMTAFGKFPTETIELVNEFIILEEGEEPPHGMALVNCAIKMLTNDSLLNFFYKSGSLALEK